TGATRSVRREQPRPVAECRQECRDLLEARRCLVQIARFARTNTRPQQHERTVAIRRIIRCEEVSIQLDRSQRCLGVDGRFVTRRYDARTTQPDAQSEGRQNETIGYDLIRPTGGRRVPFLLTSLPRRFTPGPPPLPA